MYRRLILGLFARTISIIMKSGDFIHGNRTQDSPVGIIVISATPRQLYQAIDTGSVRSWHYYNSYQGIPGSISVNKISRFHHKLSFFGHSGETTINLLLIDVAFIAPEQIA